MTEARTTIFRAAVWLAFLWLAIPSIPGAETRFIWIEGENPAVNRMTRHPWWYDQVKTNSLSGGDFISHFSQEKAGEAEYRFEVPKGGKYEFWVRANPVSARLAYRINGGPENNVPLDQHQDSVNIAADDKPDLRFLAWIKISDAELRAGENSVLFQMTSENHHHGMLDCFVFSQAPFQPRGILKPGEREVRADSKEGWFAFEPETDPLTTNSAIDLRFLNEKFAGEGGFISTRNTEFIHSKTGKAVRFWAVNGPPSQIRDREQLARVARRLAKYGVNLVRLHGSVFDKDGEVDESKIQHTFAVVDAMKAEGIYVHLSIYFPLWFQPRPDHPWLKGYDGNKHPFAALFFNGEFQEKYRNWWKALLLAKNPRTGLRLIDDPAVMGVEMQNEDSFYFWTFNPDQIPDAQMRILERQFAEWLKAKYGSLEAALSKWNGHSLKRDSVAEGRISFRPLWNIAHEKTVRDQDTVQFLFETQQAFYASTYQFLRALGFQGLITASNWATASPDVFGPLEKLSYCTGDFIDRHGYFSVSHKGENAEWSLRNGHVYNDRSALRFDAATPGKPKEFVHPAMDPLYNNKPSMISETTWNRPNRFRSEAPLYFAVYGALQGSGAIVHFALDGADWSVKPNFWMQPWTLMSPAMMGQFPAAALIYRSGLVTAGETMAAIRLNKTHLLQLKGTPLPQDASFDELRLKDVPQGTELRAGQRIDPLIHYVGGVVVSFSDQSAKTDLEDLNPFVRRSEQQVRSSTRELTLDYNKGLLKLDAPAAQGASGNLRDGGKIELRDFEISSNLELGHIVVVALDGRPLDQSRRMLLQAMSEEETTGFTTEPASEGMLRIRNIGRDPWQVKELQGSVRVKNAAVDSLRIQPLDLNGYPSGEAVHSSSIQLQPTVLYYLLTRD